ncbi:MAG: helix-hairpin-helix domain-containing protein [bacterium]
MGTNGYNTQNTQKAISYQLKGAVLIVTLWILAILTLLAISFAHRMRVEVKLTRFQVDSLRALYLAKAGINHAMAELKKDANEYDSLNEEWNLKKEVGLGKGRFICQISDEERKINLNCGTRTVLEKLRGLNVNEGIVSCLIDWRDVDDKEEYCGAEDKYYQSIGKSYHCKNNPFQSIEELLLVREVTSEILYGEDMNNNGILDPNENDGDASFPNDDMDGELDFGISRYVTVYSTGMVNFNTAEVEVLECLPFLDKELAQGIVDYRDQREWKYDENECPFPNFKALMNVDEVKNKYDIYKDKDTPEGKKMQEEYKQLEQDYFTPKSRNFKITATGIVDKVIRRVTVIFDRETEKMKYYRED